MLRLFSSIILLNVLQFGFSQEKVTRKLPVLNFDQFEPNLHFQNDTIYLVNFWATWCAPCKKELPDILKIGEKYAGDKFRIILVSLDMPNQLESRLIPYLLSNHISEDVVLLDDPNQNRWIDKVDPSWSGEIPFTVIYRKDFKITYSQILNFKTLDSIIHQKLILP